MWVPLVIKPKALINCSHTHGIIGGHWARRSLNGYGSFFVGSSNFWTDLLLRSHLRLVRLLWPLLPQGRMGPFWSLPVVVLMDRTHWNFPHFIPFVHAGTFDLLSEQDPFPGWFMEDFGGRLDTWDCISFGVVSAFGMVSYGEHSMGDAFMALSSGRWRTHSDRMFEFWY